MARPIRHPRSPYWQYDFSRQGRRYHGSTGTKSRAAAQAFIDRLLADIASGKVERPTLTLDEALGVYWQHVAERQPSARTTRSQMRALLAGMKGATPLPDISAEAITEYILRRRADVSDATVNRELQCLRRVLRWCARARGDAIPSIDWSALLLREPRERVREIAGPDEDRLENALREDLRPIFRFCLLTGCRLGSARALVWSDIDWQARTATATAKGDKRLRLHLTPTVIALLANQVRAAPQVFTWRPRGSSQPVPISADGWRKAWASALTAAGIADFRWHDLRHTFASRFRRAGGDLLALQRALGHEDLDSTRRYAHVTDDEIREGLRRMERSSSRNSPGRGKAAGRN